MSAMRKARVLGAVTAVLLTTAACGTTTIDRTITGAGTGAALGAGAGALVGPVGAGVGALVGASVGGTAGALTDPVDINLGTPIYRW
jgi:osmotically inducible lipoprotein OsmB